ncbi:hypothetical protein MNBD_ALPHA12-1288, partial [hydrothermal vent metagenome]
MQKRMVWRNFYIFALVILGLDPSIHVVLPLTPALSPKGR